MLKLPSAVVCPGVSTAKPSGMLSLQMLPLLYQQGQQVSIHSLAIKPDDESDCVSEGRVVPGHVRAQHKSDKE